VGKPGDNKAFLAALDGIMRERPWKEGTAMPGSEAAGAGRGLE
jgi:hypothetical protein